MSTRFRKNLPLVAGITLVAALAFAHGDEDHGEGAAKAPPPPGGAPTVGAGAIGLPIYVPKESQFLFSVRTRVARSREIRGQVEVLGKIVPRPDGSATLYPPQAGVIFAPPSGKLPLPGDLVKKGEVLAVLEGSLAAPELLGLASSRAEARARVATAEARVAATTREVARMEGLTGVVSEKEIQAARTELSIAQAELTGAKKAAGITSGSGSANRFALKAPLDGIVAEVGVSIGSQVDTTRPLFQIVDFERLWVKAQVFEDDLPKVQGAREAFIRPEGLGDSQFSGALISLGRIIDEQARTVPAIFEVENPEDILRVGMFVRVGILAGANLTAVTIPKGAVVDQVGRKLVYVHTAPELFEARAVTLGPDDGASVAVLWGIKEGERVVTEGISTVRVAGGGR